MSSSTSNPSQPTTAAAKQTHLTPQFCLNTTAVRDFLRLSRGAVDDSISAHVNGLLTPGASSPFTPAQTASRSTQSMLQARGRANVPAHACAAFKANVLFPSWRSREQLFEFCQKVADAPDPSAVEPVPAAGTVVDDRSATVPKMNRNYWGKELLVDERLDPYSARDYSYTRESPAQILKDVLANEQGVERIVRTRTWAVLSERCESGNLADWQDEWKSWKRTTAS